MAPQFRSIQERNAGQEAMFEAEAMRRGDIRANEINAENEQNLSDEQDQIAMVSQARAKGIEEGSRAGAVDAAEMFAAQGFIPGQMANSMRFANNQHEAMAEQQGLQMSAGSQDGAMQAQVDDISTKLLEASVQGAPDEIINQTLDGLQVPDQIKSAAAQMFLSKKGDIGSQQAEPDPSAQLVKAKPTAITQQAQGILSETDQRMQQLHQLLNPPQQEQPQNT